MGALMIGHLRRDPQLAAVAQAFGDAGRPERVALDFRADASQHGTAADHSVHAGLAHQTV